MVFIAQRKLVSGIDPNAQDNSEAATPAPSPAPSPTVITTTTTPAITMFVSGSSVYVESTTTGLSLSASKASDGTVTLRGAVHKTSSGSGVYMPSSFAEPMFTLPEGFRPASHVTVMCSGSTTATTSPFAPNRAVIVMINTDGQVKYQGRETNLANDNNTSTSSTVATVVLADNSDFIRFKTSFADYY